MSDEFTRKRGKAKFDKRKDKRRKWLESQRVDGVDGVGSRKKNSRPPPRKRNWSVDEFMDDEDGYSDES